LSALLLVERMKKSEVRREEIPFWRKEAPAKRIQASRAGGIHSQCEYESIPPPGAHTSETSPLGRNSGVSRDLVDLVEMRFDLRQGFSRERLGVGILTTADLLLQQLDGVLVSLDLILDVVLIK
jgi:hypothetical protein